MRRPLLLVPATLLAALATLGPRALAASTDFNVIVNQRNPITSLSSSDLKRIVTGGTKVWDGAGVVQLGIIPSDAPETVYLAATLDTTPRELLSLLQQQVFKGELKRPAVLRSSADCVAFATSSPGAVCVAASGVPVPPGARAVPVR